MNNLEVVEGLVTDELDYIVEHLGNRWRADVDFGNILNDISYLDNDIQIIALDLIIYNLDNLDILGLLKIYKRYGLFSLANEVIADVAQPEKNLNFRDWDRNLKKNSLKVYNRLGKIVDIPSSLESKYFKLEIDNSRKTVNFVCKAASINKMDINYIRFGFDFIETGCMYKGKQKYFIIDFRDVSIAMRYASNEDLDYIKNSPFITIDLPRFEIGTNTIII